MISKYNYKPPVGMEEADLIQVGFIGLMKAAQKYRPEMGIEFSTHAFPRIRKEISELIKAQKRTADTVNIDKIMTDDGSTLMEIIPDDSIVPVDKQLVHKEMVQRFMIKEPVITSLLLKGYKQADIAKEMGLSQERIRQKIQKLRRVVV